jgi:hypothetical protein
MARTKQEWFRIIQNDLAIKSAFVSLDDEDLEAALSDALDVWNQYIPVYDFRSVTIPNGLLILDLSSEDNVQGVGNFQYTDSTVDINRTLTPFYPMQIMSMSLQGPRMAFEVNQTIERWAQLLGGKEDQQWDAASKRLYLWNPRGQKYVTFNVMFSGDVEDIEPHRYNIFRKLFRAKARLQMIQTFNRLGPIPGPTGEVKTDMDAQQQAHDKEMEEVIPVLERFPEAMPAPRWD